MKKKLVIRSVIVTIISSVICFSNNLSSIAKSNKLFADEIWQKVNISKDLKANITISPNQIHIPITQANLDRILIKESGNKGLNYYFFDSDLNYLGLHLEDNGSLNLTTGFSESGICAMSSNNYSLWDIDGNLILNNFGQLWAGTGYPFQTYCNYSLDGLGFSEIPQIINYSTNSIATIDSNSLENIFVNMNPPISNDNKIDIFGNNFDLVNNTIFYHIGNSVYRYRAEDREFLKLFDVNTDDRKELSDFACTIDNQLFASFTDGSIAKLNKDGTVAEFLPKPNYDDLDPGMAFDHHFDLSATKNSLIIYPRYFKEGIYEPGNPDEFHPIDCHWYIYSLTD